MIVVTIEDKKIRKGDVRGQKMRREEMRGVNNELRRKLRLKIYERSQLMKGGEKMI